MKLWSGRFSKGTDHAVDDFHSSISFDRRLYRQDITGSLAHAELLCRQGIISREDFEQIDQGLIAGTALIFQFPRQFIRLHDPAMAGRLQIIQ